MTKQNRHYSKRFLFLPEICQEHMGKIFPIPSEKIRHIKKVLRLSNGDLVNVINGKGYLFEARIVFRKSDVAVEVIQQLCADLQPLHRELIIGLPKNSTMDWIIEKAVECGVYRIVPVVTSRSVVRPKPEDCNRYLNRWNVIMAQAIEQSEGLWSPHIEAVCEWDHFVERPTPTTSLNLVFVSETRQYIEDHHAAVDLWRKLNSTPNQLVRMFIGPEGGFSIQEVETLKRLGFQTVSLGRLVLRVETAVIAAMVLARQAQLLGLK